HRSLFPGNIVLYEHFQNLWVLPALFAAAELNIAEQLRNGSKSIEEISRLANVDCESLYRVLRALSGQGIFQEHRNRYFSNTATSKALLNDGESIRHVIRHHLGKNNWNTLGHLMYTLKTGENAFQNLYGKSIYNHLENNREASVLFDKSMSDLSELSLMPLIRRYDFSRFSTIADIGGGEGQFLASLLEKYPACRGILFALTEATLHAANTFTASGVSERVTIISGNFLESIPVSASLYILKNIIHNWNDKTCVELMRKISDSMPYSSRLLIIEMVILPCNRNPLPKLLDLQMLASFEGGKERTKEEFTRIISEAGLTVKRFIPTIAPLFIIEVVKK
ncbi:MAG: methyltransferase, partial [bacterium]